jgi:hypothetical protein
MRILTVLFVVVAWTTPALAAGKTKAPKRSPATRSAPIETRAEARSDEEQAPAPPAESRVEAKPAPSGKAPKARVHTFSGLDVEGKLKTPQLLYFLNRVKLELDTTGREKRSFLKELEQSSDDKGL